MTEAGYYIVDYEDTKRPHKLRNVEVGKCRERLLRGVFRESMAQQTHWS